MQEQIPALQESVEIEAGFMVIWTNDISVVERQGHTQDVNLFQKVEGQIDEKRLKQVDYHVAKRSRENIDMAIWDASGQRTHIDAAG